jgi:cyclopropane-fatty-acyl-phospholipid synthase
MFGLLSKQYIVDLFLYIQNYLSDNCIRYLIRIGLHYNNVKKNEDRENHVIEKMNKSHKITYDIEKANKQHYEVPTDFFVRHLGDKLKYSSCEWDHDRISNIHDAEKYTIQKYQTHMKLDQLSPGDRILEIGNGWGSLCISNAISFPHLQFESFSNSNTQIAYIQSQIEIRKIKNLKIWKQDIDEFVNAPINDDTIRNDAIKKYKRIVSIECLEHCRGYSLLFEKLNKILTDDGVCFFQLLAHTKHTMIMSSDTLMGRNFFSGGTIPRIDLFSKFNKHLKVFDSILVNGKEYSKTLDSWLHRMYKDSHIKSILKTNNEYQKWRLFYLMSSESFKFNEGSEYVVTYIFMNKV